jgi:hypothetical protein
MSAWPEGVAGHGTFRVPEQPETLSRNQSVLRELKLEGR